MSEEQRSAEARARAERALILLLNELGDDQPFIVVLGGLVPEVLAREAEGTIPGHLGTTDVDVLLITHVETDVDLGHVEEALDRMHFEPDPTVAGWRWRGPIDGSRVKIEFLSDLPDGGSTRPSGRSAARVYRPRTYVERATSPVTSPGKS